MSGFIKDFDGWAEYKKQLENQTPVTYNSKKRRYFHKVGEVWFCSLGVNLGVEYCGKGEHYERPILILKKNNRRILCVALTSKKPNNPKYYYDLSYMFDGKMVESYALLEEIKIVDAVRLRRRLKRVSDSDLNEVIKNIKKSF